MKNNTENSRLLFWLAVLLGIQLMPRIRNWKELKLFRPSKEEVYEHFNELFSGKIDWELIQNISLYIELCRSDAYGQKRTT